MNRLSIARAFSYKGKPQKLVDKIGTNPKKKRRKPKSTLASRKTKIENASMAILERKALLQQYK